MLSKNSVLCIKSCPWGFLFYKELFFIFPSIFLVLIYGVDNFHSFKMADQKDVLLTSWLIIYAVFGFIFFVVLISRFGLKYSFFTKETRNFLRSEDLALRAFSYSAVYSGLLLLVFSIVFLDYQHALFSTILSDENLLKVRLENAYKSSLPSQISYLISISVIIGSILAAYLRFMKNKLSSNLVLILTLIMATAGGSKAPILNVIVIYVVSYFYFFRPKINIFKVVTYSAIYFSFLIFLLFYVVSLQVPNLDAEKFMLYLLERIGVGQMVGTFETFSLKFQSNEYFLHSIPFASFIIDYPIFSKDLMLYTEGAEYDRTGVKNSLFIAESYAIGGWFLVALSPLIFALGYSIKLLIIYFSLKLFFAKIVARVYTLPILFLTTPLTG
ncbi:MAG: oligosaccharide repeat unit polymerase, partial [Campylobacterales bacterium]|nr:oligosaccharide repeat unit polymerase [Campylobacterales bacterium]